MTQVKARQSILKGKWGKRYHGRRLGRMHKRHPPWPLALTGLAIALLMLIPLGYLAIRALSVAPQGALSLFSDRTETIIGNSLLLATLVTLISTLFALPLAWLTTRTDIPFRRTWLILTTLPLVFPSYVGSFALIAMLGPRGLLYQWLSPLGIQELPSIYGLTGATWALTGFTYPYLLLSIRTGLRRLDPSTEEAARNLGFTGWQSFWRVTLPSLQPAMISGGLLVSLYVLSDFGAVSMLRYNTFTMAIYRQYTSSLDRSQAALLALILVCITTALLLASERFQGRSNARAGTGVARRPVVIALKQWKVPALIFCFLVVLVALALPMGIIIYWLIRGIRAGESLQPVIITTLNSIQTGTLSAAACIALAMPVAYLTVRYPGRLSAFVGRAIYLGYGLPGIAVALSLVFFGANYVVFLYQTLLMLIFAYTVRFIPQAVSTLRTTLLQISPRIEEASRNLGHGPLQTLRSVVLPLLHPGIWTGAALVFLTTVKELPATLLLRPTGFDTLAVQIWAATEEAFFARAAAPALILLVVSALSIGIVLHQDEQRS